jgi:hypothetical protein
VSDHQRALQREAKHTDRIVRIAFGFLFVALAFFLFMCATVVKLAWPEIMKIWGW